MSVSGIRVVTVGCGHGLLHQIYEDIARAAAERGWDNVDLVIIGGDFQALRNTDDAACLSVPSKYRKMGDYHEYYSGQRQAPYLTIFCGGNHEASNHLFELYHGGWIAHNIYYLGAANVIRFGPLRIAGMSGIWKGYDYRKPHYERIPYRPEDLHSVFHVRELDVRKLLQVRTQVDIGLSHDWPRQVEYCGDYKKLFRKKRGFEEDSQHGRLGNAAAREVLDRLRPAYWFSAHLHTEFAAVIPHDNIQTKKIDSSRDMPAAWGVEVVEPMTPSENMKPSPIAETFNNANLENGNAAHGSTAERIAAWGSFEENDLRTREQQFLDMMHRMSDDRPATAVDVTWKKASSGECAVEQDSLVYANKRVKNDDEIDLDSDNESAQENSTPLKQSEPVPAPEEDKSNPEPPTHGCDGADDEPSWNKDRGIPLVEQAVSESLRTKLPAAFAPPPAKESPRPKITPPAIKNKLTKFLALDKPNNHDRYFRLLDLAPVSDQTATDNHHPYRLQYDREWLAITRVFAEDLVLGDQSSKVPADLGEETYLPRIQEEEKWVEENIEKKGMMNIPFNFTRSAPRFNPQGDIQHPTMPMEYPNLQTAEFCELLQIENKFYLNEEQRFVNYQSVPPAQMASAEGGEDHRRGSGRRGGHRGRGHRGRGHRGYGRRTH
ncbi:Lariat debranching enzyme [Penicillium citrinum]|uniref:Lariat debranching enzyme n=1 Tax=Penicillium citrinum TaxID=5077 RepID=A0A9W9TLQ9_PENCI|nr:Lariat debranching enzyme [Penicillium citrinum]KAJ5227496.1 Lariat debranching enzyme [Penicillium citrinum]